jgi:hypothetical protein
VACAGCGCEAQGAAAAHAIVAALREDDFDRALSLGLLEAALDCPSCSRDCLERVARERARREAALSARERFRAREARLQRRQQERDARRAPAAAADASTPALPASAAAALARAKAKAAEPRGR